MTELNSTWKSKSYMQATKIAALLLFTPFFGAAIWFGFVAGPVNFSVHKMSGRSEAVVTERVIYADDYGSRRCRQRAILQGDGFLWQRQICGISNTAIDGLRKGGAIKLYGTASAFGFEVTRYAYEIDS